MKKKDFEYFRIAKHLLQKLEDLLHIEDGKLDDLKLSSNLKSLKITKCISEGSYGEFYKSNWLGFMYATKKMDVEFDIIFIKEVNIQVSLNYCNLVLQ